MRNVEAWSPSKFVIERGRVRASSNSSEVNPASRLVSNLVAGCYQTHLKDHCCGRLLDLGCGKVPFYELYRQYVSETICVDWSNSLHGTNYLDAECDLTKDLPFADASFRLDPFVRCSRAYSNARAFVARDGQDTQTRRQNALECAVLLQNA